MNAPLVDIQVIDNGLEKTLLLLEQKLTAVDPSVWDSVSDILLQSVTENFLQGGRPDKWIPSQRAMKEGGKTLIQSGALMASGMVSERTDTSVSVTWGVGLDYALIHQFGGVIKHPHMRRKVLKSGKKGKFAQVEGGEYEIVIPARPYVMFQAEDIDRITTVFQEYYSTKTS